MGLARTSDGTKSMFCACTRGHIKCVQLLLKQEGINVNQGNKVSKPGRSSGQTALMYAAWHNHEKCLELLLQGQADVNAKQSDRGTALMYAAVGTASSQTVCHMPDVDVYCPPPGN